MWLTSTLPETSIGKLMVGRWLSFLGQTAYFQGRTFFVLGRVAVFQKNIKKFCFDACSPFQGPYSPMVFRLCRCVVSVDAHMIPMPHAACAQRCQIPVHWALKWPQMQGKIAPMFYVTTLPFFPTLLESYHSQQVVSQFFSCDTFLLPILQTWEMCVCLFFP